MPAQRARPQADKVLAFEGGFHGRTLLTLHASWNPSKRAPFELPGYEVTFAPFPVWHTPRASSRQAPSGYYAAAAPATSPSCESRSATPRTTRCWPPRSRRSPRCTRRWRPALLRLHHRADAGRGGRPLRDHALLPRAAPAHPPPQECLIFDEVQTGFALGGSFAWHEEFSLVNFRGQPDYPDAVTFAKRAQVGVCMSRFEDPEPARAHAASLIRGRMHAEMVSTEHSADRIEKLVAAAARAAGAGFPHLVRDPRAKGFAFAFDLPTPAHLDAYLGQRFWRGAICSARRADRALPAVSESYLAREVDLLFEASGARWPGSTRTRARSRRRGRTSGAAAAARAAAPRRVPHPHRRPPPRRTLLPTMLDIEHRVYEPARRTPPEDIRGALRDPEGDHRWPRSPAGDRRWRSPASPSASRSSRRATTRAPTRPDAGQEQHALLAVAHRGAGVPELGLGRQHQGGAAARGEARGARRRHAALPLRDRPQPHRPHRA